MWVKYNNCLVNLNRIVSIRTYVGDITVYDIYGDKKYYRANLSFFFDSGEYEMFSFGKFTTEAKAVEFLELVLKQIIMFEAAGFKYINLNECIRSKADELDPIFILSVCARTI